MHVARFTRETNQDSNDNKSTLHASIRLYLKPFQTWTGLWTTLTRTRIFRGNKNVAEIIPSSLQSYSETFG